ncbi:MAG: DNA-directed RNA polymerase subunit beta' [candidate division WOR-3 bacterium]
MAKLSPKDLYSIRIRIASPETIRSWSHGEVKNAETLNYRSQRPEVGGLFCERIFGPVQDYKCACGRYSGRKYRGTKCPSCGVEVLPKKVRRERMGHIELAVPVAHIWFYKATPSPIGILLDLTVKDLEKVVYYDGYIVTKVSEDLARKEKDLKVGKVLQISEYLHYKELYGNQFEAEMGAGGIKKILANLNLEDLRNELRVKIKTEQSPIKRAKFLKKYKIVEALLNSKTRPEWMILEVLPVIPPDLRPIVFLENGQIATTEINQLYRRVIMRNNRLKLLKEQGAPEILINNEKRMLQEAVEALLDNSKRRRPVTSQKGGRKLKSISDVLRGKKGLLRRNLLGKRVDYSGRSVIVVAPELKLNQVALPKEMALELFRPMVEHKLHESGIASSLKEAAIKLGQRDPAIWEMLEKIIKDHPVLLNRAPTLHRVSIQAFEPVLWENKAIGLHPLVCTAYNADFDGDTMSVYVPISYEAQLESYGLLLSINNILSPAHGGPLAAPTRDIVLGINYLTKILPGDKGEGRVFSSPEEAVIAYENGYIGLRAKVKVLIDGQLVETSVGRIIFNDVLPKELRYINKEMRKGELSDLVLQIHYRFGPSNTAEILDALKELGFKYSTVSGITFGIDDMVIPDNKKEIIERAKRDVERFEKAFEKGIMSAREKYQNVLDVWTWTTEKVKREMLDLMAKDKNGFNPIYLMLTSGARGNEDQVKQLAGMRGLMARPGKGKEAGELIENPIISNFKEGLKVLEYFISTHGSRKGLSDTALKTADAGYLTRRLVDVSHNIVVTEEDCGTLTGRKLTALTDGEKVIKPLSERIVGRIAVNDIYHPLTGELLVEEGQEITEEMAKKIEESGIAEVEVRSVLRCRSKKGVCAKCYGRNLATGKIVEVGEAVGVIAAQSIGEPGTQLTLRTFHTGGTAERITEASYHEAPFDGVILYDNVRTVENPQDGLINISRKANLILRTPDGHYERKYAIPYGAKLMVRDTSGNVVSPTKDGVLVKKGFRFCEWEPYSLPILSTSRGKVRFVDLEPDITIKEVVLPSGKIERVVELDREKKLFPRLEIVDPESGTIIEEIMLVKEATLIVYDGDLVEPGTVLAKVPKSSVKTRDITGGLPQVEDYFEARVPKDKALLAEISGQVEVRFITEGKERGIKIRIHSESGDTREYIVPYGKYLHVGDGDRIEAGEPITEGPIDPHDILRIKGIDAVQEFLLDKILEVYRLSGVKIDDKHVEIIVRQMLRKVKIKDAGDTRNLVEGDVVDISVVEEENKAVREKGGKPATYEFQLLGITRAALAAESFLSAASFQETTKVLTEAAIAGREDRLEGLKENVIIGNLIPVGTGFKTYRNLVVEGEIEVAKEEEEEESSEV